MRKSCATPPHDDDLDVTCSGDDFVDHDVQPEQYHHERRWHQAAHDDHLEAGRDDGL